MKTPHHCPSPQAVEVVKVLHLVRRGAVPGERDTTSPWQQHHFKALGAHTKRRMTGHGFPGCNRPSQPSRVTPTTPLSCNWRTRSATRSAQAYNHTPERAWRDVRLGKPPRQAAAQVRTSSAGARVAENL